MEKRFILFVLVVLGLNWGTNAAAELPYKKPYGKITFFGNTFQPLLIKQLKESIEKDRPELLCLSLGEYLGAVTHFFLLTVEEAKKDLSDDAYKFAREDISSLASSLKSFCGSETKCEGPYCKEPVKLGDKEKLSERLDLMAKLTETFLSKAPLPIESKE